MANSSMQDTYHAQPSLNSKFSISDYAVEKITQVLGKTISGPWPFQVNDGRDQKNL